MPITTTSYLGGTGGATIPPFYSDFLRDNLYPQLYLRPLGTKVTVPRGHGDGVKIPRWQTPVKTSGGQAGLSGSITAVAAINENAYTSAFALCAKSITGAVQQFTGARGYTDKLIIVTKANFLEGALESLARELAFRFDRYTRANISANSLLRGLDTNNDIVASPDVKSTFTLRGRSLAGIRPLMDAYNVPPWDDEHFVAVGHPAIQLDIFKDISATGFVPINRYNNAQKIFRGEIGSMYGIRFLMSNAIPIFGTAVGGDFSAAGASATNGLSSGIAGGSNLWVFGPDAFYSVELEDGGIEVIHHPPGSSGTADAANQRGTIAVKAFYGVISAPAADRRLMRVAHAFSLRP